MTVLTSWTRLKRKWPKQQIWTPKCLPICLRSMRATTGERKTRRTSTRQVCNFWHTRLRTIWQMMRRSTGLSRWVWPFSLARIFSISQNCLIKKSCIHWLTRTSSGCMTCWWLWAKDRSGNSLRQFRNIMTISPECQQSWKKSHILNRKSALLHSWS